MSALVHWDLLNIRHSRRLTAIAVVSCACVGATASAADTKSASGTNIEEITVTAQRRQENLTNVPISISVLGNEELDRFTGQGVSEALATVPGVKFTEGFQAAGTQLGIRGVTASGPLFNGSSPVAFYVDGVPFGLVKTAVLPDANPYDLERIEVLRGPQGTLYGASALNGVVRVLTHDADLEDFEFKSRASLSSTEEGDESYRADAAINAPVVPGKLAVRASVGYNKVGGWIDSPVEEDSNDADLRSGRLRLNAQATEKLSLGLSAWIVRNDYGAPSFSDDNNEFPGASSPTAVTSDQPSSVDFEVFGLNIGYDFGAFTLSSVTSHIDYTNHSKLDFSPFFGTPFVFRTDLESEVLAQEIVLTSTSQGAWRWSLGGFYRDAEDRLDEFPATNHFSDLSESFAVYGELTRVLADGAFELTGGLRYFEDEVTQRENSPFDGDTTRPLYSRTRTFDNVSPRVVLTWHPSEGSTLYGSYSEGFRSGFNQNANVAVALPDIPPANEDTLKNFELGAKGSLFDGRLQYDAAAYYIDWQDVQQTLGVLIGTGIFTAVVNGESASGPGFDFAVTAHATDALVLGATFSWNDLVLDEDVVVPALRAVPAPPTVVDVVLFQKGERLNYSAKSTVGASAEYTFSLGSAGLEGSFSASAQYSARQDNRTLSGTNVNINESDDTVIGRTSFSLSSPDRWTASLFVDNVNNERGSPARSSLDMYSMRLRPRTYGVQLEFGF